MGKMDEDMQNTASGVLEIKAEFIFNKRNINWTNFEILKKYLKYKSIEKFCSETYFQGFTMMDCLPVCAEINNYSFLIICFRLVYLIKPTSVFFYMCQIKFCTLFADF